VLALGGIGDGVLFWVSKMTTLLARLATPAGSWTGWSVTGTLLGWCCTSQVFSNAGPVDRVALLAGGVRAFWWSQPQT
jgi:hypothetical protein